MATQRVPEWSLSDRMRKAREDAHLSQEQMAAKLRTRGLVATRQSVGAWEKGTNQPQRAGMVALLSAWAEITEVSAAWLAFGEGGATSSWEVALRDLPEYHPV